MSEIIPPALTTPLAYQELPIGLPGDWFTRDAEAQTDFLANNGPLLRIPTYLSAGWELGARLLDRAAEARGDTPLHTVTLERQLGAPEILDAFQAGIDDHTEASNFSMNAGGTLSRSPLGQTAALAEHVEAHFGPELLNSSLLFDIVGYNRFRRTADQTKAWLFENGTHNAIEAAKWNSSLRALAGVYYMRHAAARSIRYTVKPLLGTDAPRAMPGSEERFWHVRLAGTEHNFGAAYYMGYRQKSGGPWHAAMREAWAENYSNYRAIFTTALDMRLIPLPLKIRGVLQRNVRKPAFADIANGDFAQAEQRLRQAAQEHPGVFSPVSRRILLGAATEQPETGSAGQSQP